MQEVMIDIETLGTRPGCTILSIGACEFSNGSIDRTFYVNIHPLSCAEAGLIADPDTVLWWNKQGNAAKAALESNKRGLEEALLSLTEFLGIESSKVLMWANGGSFDLPILTAAFDAWKMPVPWKYYNERDYRTIKSIFPSAEQFVNNCKHDALADAVHQARTLMAIRAQYGHPVEIPRK